MKAEKPELFEKIKAGEIKLVQAIITASIADPKPLFSTTTDYKSVVVSQKH